MSASARPESPLRVAEFQRREWAVQRACWVVLWAVLAAGIFGVFGRGPLARVDAKHGGWRIEYDRFARNQTQTTLTITIPSELRQGDTATLWLDRTYAEKMDVQQVRPEPLSVAAHPGRLVYRFLTAGDGPTRVVFDAEPQAVGRLQGRIGSRDVDDITFSQLIYP